MYHMALRATEDVIQEDKNHKSRLVMIFNPT
jgi:hypothetical protein